MRIWLAMVALLLAGCGNKKQEKPAENATAPKVTTGSAGATARPRDPGCDGAEKCLPDWDFTTLDGRALPASQLRGKVTLVLFWASWCEPCTAENGGLSGVYARHRDKGFELLGVSLDETTDEKLKEWAKHYNLTFPIIRSTPEILATFGKPEVVPTTMLFDQHGNRTWLLTGVADTALIEQDIAALLAGKPVVVKKVTPPPAPMGDGGASHSH